MRRRLGSVLFMGAMMTAMAAATAAAPVAAQNTPAPAAPARLQYPLEVSATYSATLSDVVTGSSFWMQGGAVELHGQFYRGLGVVAEVAGAHSSNINSSGVGLDMVTATFGPRYTWSPAHRKYALFGQALVGVANGFNSVFPTPAGATGSNTSAAFEVGGGMNVALAPRIALRAVQANWLRTQLPNSTTNVQNNLELGAGFVFRFR